ncbi:MAG: hypothetical protein K8S87_01405 [Planctomycetes bacterium]|nr:hypothetical protein [Planctomycetota bacterium]
MRQLFVFAMSAICIIAFSSIEILSLNKFASVIDENNQKRDAELTLKVEKLLPVIEKILLLKYKISFKTEIKSKDELTKYFQKKHNKKFTDAKLTKLLINTEYYKEKK